MTATVATEVRTTPESLLLTFFGTHVRGRATRASMPSQSRTSSISPNGTPFCAIPQGPGFMPTRTASTWPGPRGPYRSR